MNTPNPATDDDLRALIRAAIGEDGTQSQWASDNDIAPSYLSEVLNGRCDVSENLARTLGYYPAEARWLRPEGKQRTRESEHL